jgi:hypothetical protein
MEQDQVKTEEDALREEGFFPMDSSAFRAVRWEGCAEDDGCREGEGHLTVVFHRTKKEPEKPGARWAYTGVSLELYDLMVVASGDDSPGKFFHREIKGKRPSKSVPAAAP